MDALPRGARLFLEGLTLPLALVALLGLMVIAALWYYFSTLIYCVGILPRLVFGPSTTHPRLRRPHFAERSAQKVSKDE